MHTIYTYTRVCWHNDNKSFRIYQIGCLPMDAGVQICTNEFYLEYVDGFFDILADGGGVILG